MQSVFDQIGGEPAVRALVERFYDLVETQPQGARIFQLHLRGHGMAHVRSQQFDFLCGFLGGRKFYAERHGHMNLREIHAHVPIRLEDAANWLFCMEQALSDTAIGEPMRSRISAAFTSAAHLLVNSPTTKQRHKAKQ